MAKKIKKTPVKSPKKLMTSEIEGRISDTLKDFPKRASNKKYKKTIQKASKILVKTLDIKSEKLSSKKKSIKTNKPVAETMSESIS